MSFKEVRINPLYIKKESDILIICMYVDEIIYLGSSHALLNYFKVSMTIEFGMMNLGLLHYFLALEIFQSDKRIIISQKKYALDLLKKFNMLNCKLCYTLMNTSEKLCVDDGTTKVDEKLYKNLAGWESYLFDIKIYALPIYSSFFSRRKESYLVGCVELFSIFAWGKEDGDRGGGSQEDRPQCEQAGESSARSPV